MVTKKGSAKKSTKKTTKKSSKKSPAKKGAAKRGAAAARTSITEAATAGCTLDPNNTVDLVLGCAPQASDISSTLGAAGINTPFQQTVFRDCIFQAVLNAGCMVVRGNIPTDPDSALRDVVFFILDSI